MDRNSNKDSKNSRKVLPKLSQRDPNDKTKTLNLKTVRNGNKVPSIFDLPDDSVSNKRLLNSNKTRIKSSQNLERKKVESVRKNAESSTFGTRSDMRADEPKTLVVKFSKLTDKSGQVKITFFFYLVPCASPGLLPVLGPLGSGTDATHLPCPALWL